MKKVVKKFGHVGDLPYLCIRFRAKREAEVSGGVLEAMFFERLINQDVVQDGKSVPRDTAGREKKVPCQVHFQDKPVILG